MTIWKNKHNLESLNICWSR